MNTIVYEGSIIYWIAVKEETICAGYGHLDKDPSVVTSKWNLEAYTDEAVWRARLINDFGIDPYAE